MERYCDPEEWAQCLALEPVSGFLCTREHGHESGPHVAHVAGSLAVAAEWEAGA